MRHLKAGRKLGRNATHRLALMRNLAMALFEHGRIITTVEKAKEVRPFVEKLITLAKRGDLHARRLALAKLGPIGNARPKANEEEEAKRDDRKVITKLFEDIGPRFRDRPGGYTRIIKRHERRLGDGGRTAFLELLKEGETKVRTKTPQAPRVMEPTHSAPESASPESQTPEPQATSTPSTETPTAPPENPPAS